MEPEVTVDMSPTAIRARLRKVDELRRLAKYLQRFRQQPAAADGHSTMRDDSGNRSQ